MKVPFLLMDPISAKKSLSKPGPNPETHRNAVHKCEEKLNCHTHFAVSALWTEKGSNYLHCPPPTLAPPNGLTCVPRWVSVSGCRAQGRRGLLSCHSSSVLAGPPRGLLRNTPSILPRAFREGHGPLPACFSLWRVLTLGCKGGAPF